ncbi:MAG TPA: ABC transporter ATP-binding protein [Candidatus Saccharimonadales bacterium]|nr:ABC transporter ATP-binding protein [Candidatus Saccharimonadales bacterium]
MKFLKRFRTGKTLEYFLEIFFKRKLAVTVNLTFTPIAVFFGEILVGYYFGKLFQKLVEFKPGGDTGALYHIAWTIVGFYLLQIAFYRVNDYTALWRQSNNLRDLEQNIFKRLPQYSYRFFSETYGGALVSQVNRFLKAYEEFDDVTIFDYLEGLSRIVLSAIMLLFIAPPLGILLAVWAPIYIFIVVYSSMRKAHATRADAAADSSVIAYLADAITNMVTIKTFAKAKLEHKKFSAVSTDRYHKRLRSWRLNANIRNLRWFVAVVFFVAYILLSIYLVTRGSISPAVMIAGQIYIFAIFNSLLSLHQVIQRTEQLFADAAELTDILDMKPELTDPKHPEKSRIKDGLIEFNSVRFKYPKTSKDVFGSLDLKIKPGERVGLVGHSGSGKSTITRLVLRFLDVDSGAILIDGQDIRNITQDDLRSKIAYIPQEPILFHRTLMENIIYGREGVTRAEANKASHLAYADNFIQRLPEKYDTLVGERGVKLSGGEKQRVAIARAMLTRAPILILDEATSALDSKSEKYIGRALDELVKGRTTLVIAHRLSTIQKLDRIIVLKDGLIIEDGTHKELLDKNGEYAELWSHQTGGFLDE